MKGGRSRLAGHDAYEPRTTLDRAGHDPSPRRHRHQRHPRHHHPSGPTTTVRDLLLAGQPQLPALPRRPLRQRHGRMGPAHRPGLAGPDPHRQPGRGRADHRVPVPADAPLRAARRRPRRPVPEAPHPPDHPGHDGGDGGTARVADAQRRGPDLARLRPRGRPRRRHGGRQPRTSGVRHGGRRRRADPQRDQHGVVHVPDRRHARPGPQRRPRRESSDPGGRSPSTRSPTSAR